MYPSDAYMWELAYNAYYSAATAALYNSVQMRDVKQQFTTNAIQDTGQLASSELATCDV